MSLNSVIMTKVRSTVIFNAADPEHRRHAYVMLKNRTLKDCPYIWALSDGQDNVFDMIRQQLSEWYADQEFGVAKLPQTKVFPISVDRKQS